MYIMSTKSSKMSVSGNETYWLNLVKDIYKNRENCPHRQSLKKVLKAASPLYCAVKPDSDKSPYGDRSLGSKGTPSSASGFTGNESGWLHLVKNILRNSHCKFHGRLKIVLKKASKVYCKPKKTAKKSSSSSKKQTKKSPSLFKSLGLA